MTCSASPQTQIEVKFKRLLKYMKILSNFQELWRRSSARTTFTWLNKSKSDLASQTLHRLRPMSKFRRHSLLAIEGLEERVVLSAISITSDQNWSQISTGSGTGGAPTPSDTISIVDGATLTVDISSAVVGNLTEDGAAVLAVTSGSNVSLGSLASAGTGSFVTLSSSDSALTVGTDGTDSSYGGSISGAGSVTKIGSGTWTLAGASTYTGPTAVNTGTLLVNGSLAAESLVSVAAGAVLGGSGTIAGTLTMNGILSPGTSYGASDTAIFNLGAISLASTSALSIDLNGTTPGAGYDSLASLGDLSIESGSSLFVSLASGYAPTMGSTYTILSSTTGSITGRFQGLPDLSTLTIGQNAFQIQYQTNSVALKALGSSTTTVQSSLTSSTYGQSITLTATVNSDARGQVQFLDGSTLLDTETLSAGVATFSTAALNAGIHSITAVYLGNNDYAGSVSGVTSQSVLTASLVISANDQYQTYGFNSLGTSAFTTTGTLYGTDTVSSVTLQTNASLSPAGKYTVGTWTLTPSAAAGSGLDNYNITYQNAASGLVVSPRTLTATATVASKTYDGTKAGTVTSVSLSGVLSGDTVTGVSTTATFSDKNVGTFKPVTVSGITLAGTDAANYQANSTATTTAAISPRNLFVTPSGVDRVYDRTTVATVTLADDRVTGDSLTTSYGAARFAEKNVGTGKTVTVSGLQVTGTDAANYTLSTTSATTTANISPRVLTSNTTVSSRVYDGTTNAVITKNTVTGVISGDTVTCSGGTATFSDKNVGSAKTVTVTGLTLTGTDAANYTLPGTTVTTAGITQRAITATISASSRVYDGTSVAPLKLSDNRIAGDVLTPIATSATFTDKNVGANKPVTIVGAAVAGADAGNYAFAAFPATIRTTAGITAKALVGTITVADKVFDNTGYGTITARTLSGVVNGDDVSYLSRVGYERAAFPDKHVGRAKVATALSLYLGGADAGNYTVNSVASTTATILPYSLTVTAAETKQAYDGTTAAKVLLTCDSVPGSTLTLDYSTASFGDKNVGVNKPLTVTGITITGAEARDYIFNSTATTTCTVNPRVLNFTATGVNKVYDGTTEASLILSDDRVSSDSLYVTYSATFPDKNVGTRKALTAAVTSVSGSDAGNYTYNPVLVVTANITKATLVVTVAGSDKVYNGSSSAAVTLSDNRVSGDSLVLAMTNASFLDKNVGTNKTVTASGISIRGTDAGNYTVSPTATTTASIAPRPLVVTATASNKVYDGGTTATPAFTDNRVNGDLFTVNFTSSEFADKNVGTGKTVTVSGIRLSGTDGGNYTANANTTATAGISTRSITVTAAASTKSYDSTTTALALPTVTSGSLVGNDTATFRESYSTPNVGASLTLTPDGTINDGNGGQNYALAFVNCMTGEITPAPITVKASDQNYMYGFSAPDAAAYSTTGTFFGSDCITGMTLNTNAPLSRSGHYNAGTWSLTPSGATGSGLSNYKFTYATGILRVNQVSLTISGVSGTNKTYDGTTNDPVTGTEQLLGVFTNDEVSLTPGTAHFADANVGLAKAVTFSGYSITGADAGNYALDQPGNRSANITVRAVTVAATPNSKTYDSTTSALAVPAITSGSLVGSDTASFTESYLTYPVGVGLTLTPNGTISDGNGGLNYAITFVNDTTGSITARAITVTAATNTKTYDSTTRALATPTVTSGSLVGTDTLSLSETYASADSGTGLMLVPSTSVSDGNNGQNYAVTLVNNTTGVILKANATIQVTPYSVTYNTNPHAATGTALGVVSESLTDLLDVSATSHINANVYTDTWTFAGNKNYNATSGQVSDVINKASTSTAISSSSSTSTYGQSVTFTALVSPVTATGSVQFYDGATPLGSPVAVSGGTAAYSTSTITAGVHAITAVYGGDGNYLTSTSGSLSQTVNKADTTTALATSGTPAVIGSSVTFTATLSPNTATGTVQFYDGSSLLGSVTVSGGLAGYSTSSLSAGLHVISAVYSGDGNYKTSTSSNLSQVVGYSSFTESGTTLNIGLAVAGQTLTIVSTSSAETFTLSGGSNHVWLCTNDSYVSGNGTSVLTISTAGLSALQTINITDPATGIIVAFANSGSYSYRQSMNVTLSSSAPGDVMFSGATSFTGSNAINITTAKDILFNSGSSLSTVDGALTLSANMQAVPTTGNFAGITVNNAIVQATGTGQVTVRGSGGTTGGSQHGVYVNAAGGKISGGTSGQVQVSGTGGAAALGNDDGVYVYGGTITSAGANVQVLGTGGGTGSGSSTSLGVDVRNTGGVITAGGSGTVTVQGTGGSSGVSVDTSSLITAAGSGAVTVTGTGPYGVRVDGQVGSNGGAVSVTGTASGTGESVGVFVNYYGQITAGGSGDVIVNGQGLADTKSVGVTVCGSITSNAGTVTVTGSGGSGANASQYGNYGVNLASAYLYGSLYSPGQIKAGGTAAVTVVGTGGSTPGSSNQGIYMVGNTASINGGGAVTVRGSGGSGTVGNNGITLYSSTCQISGGTSGQVSVYGTGGANTSGDSNGVVANGLITSNGADVQVYGTGGGGANSSNGGNYGISVTSGTIKAGGSGTVTVAGTGGTSSNGPNSGFYGYAHLVTSSGGAVRVTGTEGSGSSSCAILLNGGSITTATNGGNLTLTGDSISLNGTTAVSAGSSYLLMIQPRSSGVAVNLGSTTDTRGGPLNLSSTELGYVTGGTVNIGNTTSGLITISQSVTLTSNTVLSSTSDTGVSPSLSAPSLTMTGKTLTFASGMPLNITVNAPVNAPQYSQLKVAGTLDLTGLTLNLSGTLTPSVGNVFTIVSATSLTGTFTGLPAGSLVTLNGQSLQVAYTATSVTLTDLGGATTTTLSSSLATSTYGQSVTITASVSPTGATGTVSFYEGSTLLASQTLASGTATFTTSSFLAGTHIISAVYGGNANYTASTSANFTQTVSLAQLTIRASGQNQIYGFSGLGNSGFVAVGTLYGSDSVTSATLTTNASVSSAGKYSAGTWTLTPSAAVGTGLTNYNITYQNATSGLVVSPRTLTATATAGDKIYDGTTAGTVTIVSLSGALTGDTVNGTSTTAAFSNKNAGSNKFVTISGITLVGADAGNYTVNPTAATTATISKASLSVTATASDKVYDGATTASVTLSDNRVNGDQLTVSKTLARFSDKNVGTAKVVSVSGISMSGTDAVNYTVNATTTTTAAITLRTLTVIATASDKVYDGAAAASVTLGDNRVNGDTLTLSYTQARFSDKNAGTAKTVTVSGITMSGTDATNYAVNSTATTAATITPRPLTVTANASDKVYDGATTASVTLSDNRVNGDILTLGYTSANFSNKNVETGKIVTVSGITLGGLDAPNYTVNTGATAAASITQATLKITALATDKVYDGATTATVTLTDNRVNDDILTLGYTSANFNDKNVGTAKMVSVDGISISGTDAPNYTVNSTSTTAAAITPRPLTVTASATDKIYDRATTASATLSDNRVEGDILSLSYNTANFNNKNVGTAKTVTVSGITISGTDAPNYTVNSTAITTATITPRPLTVTATASDKVYDGATLASVTLGDDRVEGDILSLSYNTANFNNKNVDTAKTVTVSGITISGTDAPNYTVNSTATTTATITPRPLTVTATASDKVYDGETTAGVTLSDNRVNGDVLTLDYTSANFSDKKVGTAKPVTVSGITIAGTDAANYSANSTATTTAAISPRTLFVTPSGVDRVYDRTTVATVTLADDRVTGDSLTTSYGAARFAEKNVGTGKTVTVSGLQVTGTDAANYTLSTTSATTTANISPRVLTSNTTVSSRVYDGTTNAVITKNTVTGVISGDTVTCSGGTATFSDKNVGSAKTVTVTGLTLTGTDAANYTLPGTTVTTAGITQRAITATISASSRVYDGTSVAPLKLSDNRIAGDVLTPIATSATFTDKNVGANKPVTIVGAAVAGADAGNYAFAAFPATIRTTAGITAKALVGTITVADKVFDNTGYGTITARTLSGVVNGDDVSYLSRVGYERASFPDKHVGRAKVATAYSLYLSGADAGNYTASGGATTLANIMPYTLTVTAKGMNQTYDGTTAAKVLLTCDSVLGSTLTLAYSAATFLDKNVGFDKPVNVTGIQLGGPEAQDYVFNSTTSTTSNITPRTLVFTATSASKKYDGTTKATITSLLDDHAAGDIITISYAAAMFETAAVGTSKKVTVGVITVTGSDAANYAFPSYAYTTADITL